MLGQLWVIREEKGTMRMISRQQQRLQNPQMTETTPSRRFRHRSVKESRPGRHAIGTITSLSCSVREGLYPLHTHPPPTIYHPPTHHYPTHTLPTSYSSPTHSLTLHQLLSHSLLPTSDPPTHPLPASYSLPTYSPLPTFPPPAHPPEAHHSDSHIPPLSLLSSLCG